MQQEVFTADHIRNVRAQCYELSHDEFLVGQLMASNNTVVIEFGHLERDKRGTPPSIMLAKQCVARSSSFCIQLERRDCTISPKA